MQTRVPVLALMLLTLARPAPADGPQLLFDRSQIVALRERIQQPELAPVWARTLAAAEAFCDPQSPQYADPQNPGPLPPRRERMEQKRHDALLVHAIGGWLTQRMETIGFAYQLTGRKELGRHGAALLLATVERYPAAHPIVAKGFAGGRGDIMRGLALGYDLLAECLDEPQRQRVAAAAADYLDRAVQEFNDPHVWWCRVHNYNGVNGGAAGCLALALRDAYPTRVDAWLATCVKTITRWLDAGFDPQGAYAEGVAYSGYGLSNTVLFADALRRTGKGRLFDHPTFGRLATFYALSLLPGESVYDARNDSGYTGLNAVLLKLAEARQSGLYRWLWEQSGTESSLLRIVWDNRVPALDPVAAGVPRAKHFPGRGLCVWRTGWTKNDVMFSLEAGPFYPVTHNQADKGHFTLYGLGQRWATDCGYANEHGREGRGQTLGHSCVLVDGQGQALSGAGLGTNGRIVHYANNERYGYALADCTEAYNRNSRGTPGAGVEHARRHALFVYPHQDAPAYAVVIDDVKKDDHAHQFTWQMMFADGLVPTLADGRAVFEPQVASGDASVDSPAGADRQGTCRLDFTVPQAGEYVLWGRVRAGAQEPGKSNSFFVAVDRAAPIAWHTPPHREWTWTPVCVGDQKTPVRFTLAAGTHQLVLRMREPGAQVDCLQFTRDAELAPALATAHGSPLFLEAEAGQLAAPMRVVPARRAEPRLVVRLHAAAKPALAIDAFRPVDYHAPAAFPRLRATVESVNPKFVAVLLPLPADVAEPEVQFTSVASKHTATIRWPTHTDTLVWTEQDGSVRLGE
jgi:hypothetical protein